LKDYLERHPEIERKLTKGGHQRFYTTDSTEAFDKQATVFFGKKVESQFLKL
jgi:glutamate racemase